MRRRATAQGGQAAVELVAVLPFVALLAMLLWQLAVAGQAAWLAGSAARAAARANAVNADATAAARSVLPDRLEQGLRVHGSPDGDVTVTLSVPSVAGTASLGSIEGRARFEPQGR
ncbi:MAG: pilus assembly protein [Solirubrobacteraceae bacterium]